LHEAGDGAAAVVDDVGVVAGEERTAGAARSDKAPMVAPLVRVAVPADEPRTTPAAGRPYVTPTLVRSACQPPITDPAWTLTVTLPLPLVALIPVPNSPWASTLLLVLTCTEPVIEVGTGFIGWMSLSNPGLLRSIVPLLSASMPTAFEPFVVSIGPEEFTVMLPLPEERAVMPVPFPPEVVMPGPV
jgi:hypothetical protein